MNENSRLVEALADQAHISWSGWQQYVFDKSIKNDDGTYTIPAWAVERWERQIKTDYKDLSDKEKESDRVEARKYLKIFEELSRKDND